jgi:hypothetical protein
VITDPLITCRGCGHRHARRYMCDPLLQVFTAIMDAAEARDIPVTEFIRGEPPPHLAGMLGDDTVLCRQIIIKGAVVPFTLGDAPVITQPALIFTGQDADGKSLPQWVFPGSAHEVRALRDVMDRMTEMAIRRAEARG